MKEKRMLRRMIALVAVLALSLSLGLPVAAAGYVDVPADAWYYEAVMDVSARGLFSGTDSTHFSPDLTLTRGMFVTVLWRYAGKPTGSGASFSDVKGGDYFYEAVGWASGEGLVNGVSTSKFAPYQDVSREQMATMLYRYAQYLELDVATRGSLDAYKDGTSVSGYARDAVLWAVEQQYLRAPEAVIRPQERATRAEAAFLWSGFATDCEKSETQNGINGKSAYELAVENGYEGTVQEWLASLVGAAGADGKSAYELAVENGYEGTAQEWLQSLVGSDGADGLSAYEIAVNNGYKGTEQEWLKSLAGVNGLSAYEIAVKNGYKGTELEWLESLVGETGADGASAYELAVAKGYKGSEEDWLLTLVGPAGKDGADGKDGVDGANGKSAYELAVANGFKGDLSQWLDSLVGADGTDGEDGLSAYEVALKNGYKGTEEEWLASLQGKDGADGKDGAPGKDGEDGKDGADGKDGVDGKDGADGAPGADGKDGEDGKDGAPGADGKDGVDGKDGEDGVSVVNAYIDENLHLILEMSDGSTIDAGYVGTAPSQTTYTVTFVDYNGTTLKTETVISGGSATPPADPQREGYTFVGWSGSYTNITSDVVLVAQYQENAAPTASYTVTFVDYDGTVLKLQVVEAGKSATAPADPVRAGYAFTGWDKAFTNVQSDLTVTAKYELTPTTEPTILVSDANATAGATQVQVIVSIRNNPGIVGMTLKLNFDDSVLTLTSVEKGEALSEMTFTKPKNLVSGCNFPWDAQEVLPENATNGEILILTFSVQSSAPAGRYAITLRYDDGAIIDNDLMPVDMNIINGYITVK